MQVTATELDHQAEIANDAIQQAGSRAKAYSTARTYPLRVLRAVADLNHLEFDEWDTKPDLAARIARDAYSD